MRVMSECMDWEDAMRCDCASRELVSQGGRTEILQSCCYCCTPNIVCRQKESVNSARVSVCAEYQQHIHARRVFDEEDGMICLDARCGYSIGRWTVVEQHRT